LPAVVDDLITTNPQTSYGTQKVIGEYLVNDSRKGFLDGRSLRLPTILVRAPASPIRLDFCQRHVQEPLNDRCARFPWRISTEPGSRRPGKSSSRLHAHDPPASAWVRIVRSTFRASPFR
jgi:hypothetical protein